MSEHLKVCSGSEPDSSSRNAGLSATGGLPTAGKQDTAFERAIKRV